MNAPTAVNGNTPVAAPVPDERLTPQQHRAIGMLSLGVDMSETATSCNITRRTLSRWKQMPAFQRALTRQVGEMMNAIVEQVQTQARVLIEGSLDASHRLREMVIRDNTPVSVRRQACNDMLRHEGRFLDLLGYNAKLSLKRKLANQELGELQDAEENPDCYPPPHPSDINDLARKKESEQTPPPPHAFHHTPPVAFAFRDNPINEDGTRVSDGDRGSGVGDRRTESAQAEPDATLRSLGVPPGLSESNDSTHGTRDCDCASESTPSKSEAFRNHDPECYWWHGHECNMACFPKPTAEQVGAAKLRDGPSAAESKKPWPNKYTRPQWQPPQSVRPQLSRCSGICNGACEESCNAGCGDDDPTRDETTPHQEPPDKG
jgi:hypothetical protein